MKLLLEINDNKATFFMEVIKHFSFIKKATAITDAKATLMQDIKEAVDELNLVKSGELKARNAEELIDEFFAGSLLQQHLLPRLYVFVTTRSTSIKTS